MENKKQVLYARSKEDGIVFYSNKFPVLCYETYINKEGEIQTKLLPSGVSNMIDYSGMLFVFDSKKLKKIQAFFKVGIFILAIISIILTKRPAVPFALLYFSILASEDLIKFCIISYRLKCGNFKSTGRFHSAEHMVINAYEKLQRIPTMEEVKKASRISKDCGSRKTIDKLATFAVVGIAISTSGLISIGWYFTLCGIAFVLSLIEQKFNLLRWLQILVTNKPTDKELEAAIAGITFFENMEAGMPKIAVGNIPAGAVAMRICIIVEDEEDSGSDECDDNSTGN